MHVSFFSLIFWRRVKNDILYKQFFIFFLCMAFTSTKAHKKYKKTPKCSLAAASAPAIHLTHSSCEKYLCIQFLYFLINSHTWKSHNIQNKRMFLSYHVCCRVWIEQRQSFYFFFAIECTKGRIKKYELNWMWRSRCLHT